MTTAKKIFRLRFINEGKVFEIYTKQVVQSFLPGFIEFAEVTFGERSQLIVDPSEEELKSVFSGVKRSHIPMHAVIRIDEVAMHGTARISPLDPNSNVAHFPAGAITPPGNDPDKQ